MPHACRHVAGLATLLICGWVHAADDDAQPYRAAHVVVESVRPKAKSKLQTAKRPVVKRIARKVIALPAEIAGLFLGQGLASPTFAGQRVTTSFVDAQGWAHGWNDPSNLGLPASSLARQADTLELDLSEARMAVWLSHDLNVQCGLDRDPAIARGDQFAVKLGLQFRFR